MEESLFREKEKNKSLRQIREGQIFNGDFGGKQYYIHNIKQCKPKPDLLMEGTNNIYRPILYDVVLYFALNKIKFHHLEGDSDKDYCIPSGHTLSSQVACLNHLFPLRHDKDSVLKIAKTICPEVTDVLEIKTDSHFPGYISFEAVSDTDHLNEGNVLRGTMCTSIDALICAVHKNGGHLLLPIEWKYTECYDDKDSSIEDRHYPKFEKEGRGKERLRRYSTLIDNSKQLKPLPSYKNSIYFFEPFYQLMRQTLWAEQLIANKNSETIKADDFIHVHVIPDENHDLLKKKYASGNDMETTWRDQLINQDKYKIITPVDLLGDIDKNKYGDLIKYISDRYWNTNY